MVQSNRAIKRPNLPPTLFNNYTLHTRYKGADFIRPAHRNVLKNSEIYTEEGAVGSTKTTAPFLHTRSFNILRRTGTGTKRKTSENQRFSEVFVLCLYPKSAQYIAISSVQEGSRVFEARFAPSIWIVRCFSVICIDLAEVELFPLGAIEGSCFCQLWYINNHVPQHRSKMYHSVSCAYCTIKTR